MNLAAPAPAKKTNTASGLSEAISERVAWHSVVGNGEDVDLLSHHQLVHVGGRLGGVGLVVHGDPLDLASAEAVVALGRGQLHGIGDVVAEGRVGAGVRQEKSDPDLRRLRIGRGERAAGGGGRRGGGGKGGGGPPRGGGGEAPRGTREG